MCSERAIVFECKDDRLVGIAHIPSATPEIGVIIVVGGPQYRIGSHRQFVLLSRYLAKNGIAVLRFDHRGIGDSEGEAAGFEKLDDDIRAAIDALLRLQPEIKELFLWGLCDAASAIALYAGNDARISGLVVLNPWTRTAQGYSKTLISTYYLDKIRSANSWRRLVRSPVSLLASVGELFRHIKSAVFGASTAQSGERGAEGLQDELGRHFDPSLMILELSRFDGRILTILSENDITADEFRQFVKGDRNWQKVLDNPRNSMHQVAHSNHTFSSAEWRREVEELTLDWILAP